MSYVITAAWRDHASCGEAFPVDCIRIRPEVQCHPLDRERQRCTGCQARPYGGSFATARIRRTARPVVSSACPKLAGASDSVAPQQELRRTPVMGFATPGGVADVTLIQRPFSAVPQRISDNRGDSQDVRSHASATFDSLPFIGMGQPRVDCRERVDSATGHRLAVTDPPRTTDATEACSRLRRNPVSRFCLRLRRQAALQFSPAT